MARARSRPLSASETGKPTAATEYDYFHINSIQQLDSGNLLVSARNTWAVYEISRNTGKVIWTLGGKKSSFKAGSGTQFEWQHDARMQPNGSLTLFDDGATPKEEGQSRAIQLTLDTSTVSVSLDHTYTHTPSLLAGSQGDYQTLPNGNPFVGWGAEPDFSEYTPERTADLQRELLSTGHVISSVPPPLDGAAHHPPVDSGKHHASRAPRRLRQLERRHQRRRLAAHRRTSPTRADATGLANPTHPGSRPPSRPPHHSATSQSGRLTSPAGVLATSAAVSR